ncbi:5-formyltetrahydrofolate cyclo-ligase [Clostridium sp. DSM 8431]|nr:5-formyltetrahydrofolate cyclo-ligase [Clostridium sp. DSM 8431]
MDKKTLRKEILKKRGNISKEERTVFDNIIKEKLEGMDFFNKANNIFIYVGFGSEINTIDYINEFLKMGKRIFVPRTNEENKTMDAVEIKSLDSLVKSGKYQILEPSKEIKAAEKSDLDLVILPGVAFDDKGGRVGYGAGYYDKYLKGLSEDIPKAALCYDFQLIDKVPMEEHDVRADYIITEKRFIVLK